MPPKPRITKEMIISAGFELVKNYGIEKINVRNIASALNCSTQPIMYHYRSVDELKNDIYAAADKYHSEFIMNISDKENIMISIGLNYIRFAVGEQHLFRFLFQSDKFTNTGFTELLSGELLSGLIEPLCFEAQLSKEEGKEVFMSLFVTVHGLASLYANNSMKYEEEVCTELLVSAMFGTIGYITTKRTASASSKQSFEDKGEIHNEKIT